MQSITTLIILTTLFQPCHLIPLYRPPVNYIHVAGAVKQIVAVPENLDNLFAIRSNLKANLKVVEKLPRLPSGQTPDSTDEPSQDLGDLGDLDKHVFNLSTNLACPRGQLVSYTTDGQRLSVKCNSPTSSPFRFQFPLEVPASSFVRKYFAQPRPEFLPENWSEDLAFLRRRARLFVDLEDEEVDMSPQNAAVTKPAVPTADALLMNVYKRIMSSIQDSEDSLAAQTKSTTLGRAETTTSLPTRTGTRLPTPLSSAQWAYIFHKYYPALFSTSTPTPAAKVPVQTPLFYETTTVSTWTMDVLYPGDPVPTLTSFLLSPVYLNDIFPTTTSTSTLSTSSTNVGVPARARGRGVVVMSVVMTLVVMV